MKIYDKSLSLRFKSWGATYKISTEQRGWLKSRAAEQGTTVSGIAKYLLGEAAANFGYTGKDYAGIVTDIAAKKGINRSEVVRGIIDAAMGVNRSLEDYVLAHIQWSVNTFGPGRRTAGLVKHILKEIDEISAAPDDRMEPVDVIITTLDLLWRMWYEGDNLTATPAEIAGEVAAQLTAKQAKNKARQWPEPVDGEPCEHIRE